MIIKKILEVASKEVAMEGAKDVKVKVLFGPADGAPTFAMRVFELAPSGHTPYHNHPFEHEVMILAGDVAIVTPDGEIPVQAGHVILVAPNDTHQFKNRSDTQSASFMCLVPIAYQS